jgi:hypothetical protein
MFILLRRNKIEHLMHRLIIVSLFVVIELNIIVTVLIHVLIASVSNKYQ